MGLLRWLLGGKSTPKQGGNPPARPVSREEEISHLVEEGWKTYPREDPSKSLALFLKAIILAPPAPNDPERQEQIDTEDVGMAVWAASVCHDALESPQDQREQFMILAKEKSPATVARIIATEAQSREKAVVEKESQDLLEEIANSTEKRLEELTQKVDKLISLCEPKGLWWTLRDAAVCLFHNGQRPLAWKALNKALESSIQRNARTDTIFSAMGDFNKREEAYDKAARNYLLSCTQSGGAPTKTNLEQARICIKKAGIKGEPATIRDNILALSSGKTPEEIIALLDTYFPS